MQIFPIEAFSDNYIWIIEEDNEVTIVDPGEADKVLEYLDNKDFTKINILLTHNHGDHIDGVAAIVNKYAQTTVFGPIETNSLNDTTVADGDSFKISDKSFEVFKTAGHTEEHISYLMDNELFCGDALFSAGCGRVFTGDYEAAYAGMEKFRKLPADTNVYAGHEYTETNLRFAHSIEPSNQLVKEALEHTKELRANDRPTLPSTIGKEKEINLFMQADSLDKFMELRNARDDF